MEIRKVGGMDDHPLLLRLPMGKGMPESIIDSCLRVHRAEHPRIADASVFPNITSGNTNAPSIMVSEKALEIILEDEKE